MTFVDSAGSPILQTDSLGRTTRFDFDGMNELTKVTDALAGETLFTYDGAGNLRTAKDARTNVTTYGYTTLIA